MVFVLAHRAKQVPQQSTLKCLLHSSKNALHSTVQPIEQWHVRCWTDTGPGLKLIARQWFLSIQCSHTSHMTPDPPTPSSFFSHSFAVNPLLLSIHIFIRCSTDICRIARALCFVRNCENWTSRCNVRFYWFVALGEITAIDGKTSCEGEGGSDMIY